MKMFDTNLPHYCEYCVHCAKDADKLICRKKNEETTAKSDCRGYEYDPIKRVPRALPRLPQFNPNDFAI